MNRSAYAGLLLPLATIAVAAGDAAPDLLTKKVAALAGADARDCGTVALYASRASAIACARDTKTAYRVVFELSGADSYTWQAGVRDAEGRLWVVFYDADRSAGADASPGLAQLLCRDLFISADKDDAIDCVPAAGSQ